MIETGSAPHNWDQDFIGRTVLSASIAIWIFYRRHEQPN